MNEHLKTAYWLGTQDANLDFDKHAMSKSSGAMTPEAMAMYQAQMLSAQRKKSRPDLQNWEPEYIGVPTRTKNPLYQGAAIPEGTTRYERPKQAMALPEGVARHKRAQAMPKLHPALRNALIASGLLGGTATALQIATPLQKKEAMGEVPPEGVPPQEMPPEGMPPEAAPNLGDPNFWGGGSPAEGGAAPTSAEEAVGLLPAGTFQGLNTRMTPDGQKSIGVKVTPDALAAPEALQAMFQSEPGVRVEITAPDTPAGVTSFRET